MALRLARLPGIRFEVQPPPPAIVLPRMDIAVLVGFAASGPLNLPVAVEDPAHFSQIFGADLSLAWDDERGEMVSAYLASAVRAFFRNGGRRCWVVRVAGEAKTNVFPVPGLLEGFPDGRLLPAYAAARSPGSWSDGMYVSAYTLSRPLRVHRFDPVGLSGVLIPAKPGEVSPGDLLRLTYQAGAVEYLLMFSVRTIQETRIGVAQEYAVQVQGQAGRWFRRAYPGDGVASPLEPGIALLYGPKNDRNGRPLRIPMMMPGPEIGPSQDTIAINLALTPEKAPELGSFVRAALGGRRLWLAVTSVETVQAGSPLEDWLRVEGQGLWVVDQRVGTTLFSRGRAAVPAFAERLSLVIQTQREIRTGQERAESGELGLAPEHPDYWGALPDDEQLYAAQAHPWLSALAQSLLDNPNAGLWQAAVEPRFPLSGGSTEGVIYPFPLLSGGGLASGLSLGSLPQAGTSLERDGLSSFSADLFLDPDLANTGSGALLAQADFIRYQQPLPRRLKGIHAALDVEEATLIAVPDAVQRGWLRDTSLPPIPEVKPPVVIQDQCQPPLPEPGQPGAFIELVRLGAPELQSIDPPEIDKQGYRISWNPPAEPLSEYWLEEASRADFGDAVVIYQGSATSLEVTNRSPGAYFYRVRAIRIEPDGKSVLSSYSNAQGVQVGARRPWQVLAEKAFSANVLFDVQLALLNLCAARSDLFALLSLPAHYREDEALDHAARLIGSLGDESSRTLSFGALYHPWPFSSDEGDGTDRIFLTPPDGAISGMIARRALRRGAWLAPANELLRDVLALQPSIAAERFLELQEGSLNIIRQEPAGFLTLCANTLSTDEDLRLINVRRLLILLRRLALREGATYVFEPNSPAFRRQVERGFEALLEDLFLRGAFSGSTAETSFQVNVGPDVNPPASIDQGRLVVELRVAPAHPLAFITVRLVHTGDRNFQVQEVG